MELSFTADQDGVQKVRDADPSLELHALVRGQARADHDVRGFGDREKAKAGPLENVHEAIGDAVVEMRAIAESRGASWQIILGWQGDDVVGKRERAKEVRQLGETLQMHVYTVQKAIEKSSHLKIIKS
jgi:molybdate-binding protein